MSTLKKITPFLLSICWVILALWLEFVPKTPGTATGLLHYYFKRVDYLAYDIKMLARAGRTQVKPSQIAIIAIDDNSLQQEGRWPWPYFKIAQLIAKLREQHVSVISSDIILSEPEPNLVSLIEKHAPKNPSLMRRLERLKPAFDDNDKLIRQIQQTNNIVLPFLFNTSHFKNGLLPKPLNILNPKELNQLPIRDMQGYLTSFPALQQVSRHNGFLATLTDEDGVIRRTPLILRYQNNVYPSLALATAQVVLSNDGIKLNRVKIGDTQYLDSIQLGNLQIPTDKNGRLFIPFHGKPGSYKYYSATDLLNNKLKPDELKNKMIIIGITAAGTGQVSNTPVDSAMPAVEVQANLLDGILNGETPHLAFWAKAATTGLIVIIGTTLTIALPLLSPGLSILLATGILLALVAINIGLWITLSIVFSFSIPFIMTIMLVLTNMACGFFFESNKRKFLRETFSHYLPPEYIKVLLDNPDEYSLEGESVELTVLFADIRNFTSMTEQLDASHVKKLLNQYFSPMTKIIFNHRGTIDKYVGDMIMAFWGAPIKNPQHREDAINAALDMLAQSEKLKSEFIASGLPEINIGIGINTGLMNVGDMGSEFRRAYTVLGDPVNLGSRLESATKYYGVRLIVGNATREGQTGFVFRLLDRVKVKGKHEAVDIYEVVCRTEDATPELLQEINAHEKAIHAWFAADWELAQHLFASLANQYPDRMIYQLFLERIVYFEQNPPGPGWDGSFERTDK